MSNTFESLAGWEATRDTLQLYANIPSVVAQGHLEHHPKWWHISLKVVGDGLVSSTVPLPDGGSMFVKMDLVKHEMQVIPDRGETTAFDLTASQTSTALGEKVLDAVRGLGLDGVYKTEKYANDAPRVYDPAVVERYFGTLKLIDAAFKSHKKALGGETSPVQLWPHHFDLSMEWFGTRKVPYEQDGETTYLPAQLNLGFSPGDGLHPAPYFYSNPWPFEKDVLLGQDLPHGARWFTDGWEGSLLPYEALVGDANGVAKLGAYARAVFGAVQETLVA